MNVLLVEDVSVIRLMMAHEVTEHGWTPVEAGSVEAALACWRTAGIDAAVVDIGLPDGSGADLIVQLRADMPELPVVVHTGYGENDIVVSQLPADIAVVEKPAKRAAIAEALRNASMAVTLR